MGIVLNKTSVSNNSWNKFTGKYFWALYFFIFLYKSG